MSVIPDSKDAKFIQLIQIGTNSYVKFTTDTVPSTDKLLDITDINNIKTILEKTEGAGSGQGDGFNSMKILNLPSSFDVSTTQVGYIGRDEDGAVFYEQYLISTGEQTVNISPVFVAPPNTVFESWDANGLVGDDLRLVLAYSVTTENETNTFCKSIKGNNENLTSFTNNELYRFQDLYVSRGKTTGGVSILLPTGAEQDILPENDEVGFDTTGTINGQRQIASLACYIISSFQFFPAPSLLNITSFFPTGSTEDEITSENYKITIKATQASYDAQFISMLVEFSFDQKSQSGTVRLTENLVFTSNNGGLDYFLNTPLQNTVSYNLSEKKVKITKDYVFVPTNSLTRVENDTTNLPLLVTPKPDPSQVRALEDGDPPKPNNLRGYSIQDQPFGLVNASSSFPSTKVFFAIYLNPKISKNVFLQGTNDGLFLQTYPVVGVDSLYGLNIIGETFLFEQLENTKNEEFTSVSQQIADGKARIFCLNARHLCFLNDSLKLQKFALQDLVKSNFSSSYLRVSYNDPKGLLFSVLQQFRHTRFRR